MMMMSHPKYLQKKNIEIMMTDPHRFLMLSAKKSEKIPNKSAKIPGCAQKTFCRQKTPFRAK